METKEFAQKMREDLYYWIMGEYENQQIKIDNMIKKIEDEYGVRFVKNADGFRTLILDGGQFSADGV